MTAPLRPDQLPPEEVDRRERTQGALYYVSAQELKFAEACVLGMTHAEAARQAGYVREGASYNTRAADRGRKIFNRPIVRAAIHQLKMNAIGATGISLEWYVRELASMAFCPEEQLDGKLKPADKLRALTLIAEFLKLEKIPGEQAKSLVDVIVEAGQRKIAVVPTSTGNHSAVAK